MMRNMNDDWPEDDMWQWGGPNDYNEEPFQDNNYGNDRYRNAYGNYSGGYPPGGSRPSPRFGPPLGFRPTDPYMPPPPPGPGPQFMMGRGYGPFGPPKLNMRQNMRSRFTTDDRAIKYLQRCGFTREAAKSLPSALLQLVDPQHCGVCGMDFESFAMSRLHYGSKNHAKQQQKWLTQYRNETNLTPRGREEPMKSRDLYCELCDVEITSKLHAESHYAGKPHRAIVDGRKQPKNPFLLQRGMENRVAKLIRREKKQLKALDEAEQAEVQATSFKDLKATSAELRCEICQTFVTNSEQMTMHLNGKRHLNKEKQHILQMMRGNKPSNSPEAANDVEEVADDDQNGEGVETAAAEGEGDEAEKDKDGEDGEEGKGSEHEGKGKDGEHEEEGKDGDDGDWQNGTGADW